MRSSGILFYKDLKFADMTGTKYQYWANRSAIHRIMHDNSYVKPIWSLYDKTFIFIRMNKKTSNKENTKKIIKTILNRIYMKRKMQCRWKKGKFLKNSTVYFWNKTGPVFFLSILLINLFQKAKNNKKINKIIKLFIIL